MVIFINFPHFVTKISKIWKGLSNPTYIQSILLLLLFSKCLLSTIVCAISGDLNMNMHMIKLSNLKVSGDVIYLLLIILDTNEM